MEKLTVNSVKNFDSEVDYTTVLDNFEGPLDLLLHLIKQSKLEIEEVELSKITEQYLEIIGNLSAVDMENASEFIEIAATLIEIKSKSLLPKLEEGEVDEEDPEYLLKIRLQEYKLIKETTERLKLMENTNRFYKKPEPEAGKFRYVLKDMNFEMLIDAFTRIMHRVSVQETKDEAKEIKKEKFTIAQKVATIKDSLIMRKQIKFSELFASSINRDEVITTFLAVLEMLKLQEIRVVQTDNFGDIEISKVDEENNG